MIQATRPWEEEDGEYLIHLKARPCPTCSELSMVKTVVELRDGRTFGLAERDLKTFIRFALQNPDPGLLAAKLQELCRVHNPSQDQVSAWKYLMGIDPAVDESKELRRDRS